LDTGEHLTYLIKFQVVAPLPAVLWRDLELPALPDAQFLGNQIATKGWVIKKEEVANPSSHPLHLWLRSRARDLDTLGLTNYLGFSEFIEQPYAPPKGPVRQFWVSKGDLRLSHVRILHYKSGKLQAGLQLIASETVILDLGQWQGVPIEPGETLVLEWLARTQLGVRDCSLPESQVLKLFWKSRHFQPRALVEVISKNKKIFNKIIEVTQVTPLFSKDVVQEWSILGTEISGRWSRDLQIAYPFLSLQEATQENEAGASAQSPWSLRIATGSVETALRKGETRTDSLQFSCQGVLR
jgi:hypothetical protein